MRLRQLMRNKFYVKPGGRSSLGLLHGDPVPVQTTSFRPPPPSLSQSPGDLALARHGFLAFLTASLEVVWGQNPSSHWKDKWQCALISVRVSALQTCYR